MWVWRFSRKLSELFYNPPLCIPVCVCVCLCVCVHVNAHTSTLITEVVKTMHASSEEMSLFTNSSRVKLLYNSVLMQQEGLKLKVVLSCQNEDSFQQLCLETISTSHEMMTLKNL